MVFRKLQNKDAVIALFRDVAPKVGERHGGYTRIFKTEFRTGDNASMCLIELIDFNENMLKAATEQKVPAKKTRRSRGAKKKEETPVAETTTEETSSPKESLRTEESTGTEEKKSE